jgi:L-seryl-tRNA(Ser) seleniumtransferase
MGIYEGLGVRRVLNAAAAQTKLGGSLMPEPVLAAMHDAAGAYVDLPELHDRVGERIAARTGNEAACVACGAAAGLMLAAAACVVGNDHERVTELPDVAGFPRHEVVTWRSQRNGFLSAVRETGATVVEVGPDPGEFAAALGERTAAVLWFAGSFFAAGALPLADAVRIAHARGVPVVVDAADQIPPVANLWRFTRDLGADLAVFSGGKGLRGPQASGLIVGRADLVRGCRANGGPFHSIGRPAKVGKEEMVGLLVAVELALGHDEATQRQRYQAVVDGWAEALGGIPGVAVDRTEESHIGQPIPRLVLRFGSGAARTRDAVIAALWERDPRIAVLPHEDDAIALNPHLLAPGEADLVSAGIGETLLTPDTPAR